MGHKVFCKYSGAILVTTSQFTNAKRYGGRLVAAVHPVLDLSVGQLLSLAGSKDIHAFSNTERHILLVAMLKQIGLLDIRFPIMPACISPRKVTELLPAIERGLIAIKTSPSLWETVAEGIPKTRIGREGIDLLAWTEMILLPTIDSFKDQLRAYSRIAKKITVAGAEDTPDEIDMIHALNKELSEWRRDRKRNSYKSDLGQWAIDHVEKQTGTLPADTRVAYKKLLNAPVERITQAPLVALRKILIGCLPQGQGDKLNPEVTNTMLVMRHIDSRLEYFEEIYAMLGGGELQDTKVELPNVEGVSYTIKTVSRNPSGTSPKHSKAFKPKVVDNAKAASRNPALAALLALKS